MNDRGTRQTQLVRPYCIIYTEGGFRLVGLAIELLSPDEANIIDAQFWGTEGLIDPVALFRAVRILDALDKILPNSLCSAWFASKGLNGTPTPGDVPSLIQNLGNGRFDSIMALFPRELQRVLEKLWRYHIRVETTSLQELLAKRQIDPIPELERIGVLKPAS
ncbi:hypothetical protein KKG41_06835 [Patescibacteria group bacterium]|nr:hypothetical protein [Patescibacteria group bacterium]